MLRPHAAAGVLILGAGLVALHPPAPAQHELHVHAVRLTGGDAADSPLGDGEALIMGATGLPTPSATYADFVDELYLAPSGFTGTTHIVTTPEGLYPFLGPFGETLDASEAQGQQTVDSAILQQLAGGHVDAANPVVVFGYSQSSVIGSLLMPQLESQGVPSDDVHVVLVGDPSAPDGGILERFDLPAGTQPNIPSLGLTFSGAESSDLYPTDVYTHEYDGFADFPQYPIDPLSDLNAVLGVAFEHSTYLGLTPSEIQDAIALPTSAADTLTNYYMIPVSTLPLLDPLLLIPVIGKPIVDLLQPDLSVLVNLGYGDISEGWSQGDADVPTTLGFLPGASVLEQVPQALIAGLGGGVSAALDDLMNPGTYAFSLPTWVDELIREAPVLPGSTFSILSPVPTTLGDLVDTFPPHTGIPALDVATALLITFPEIDYQVFVTELADHNLADAVGIPIAVDFGLLPFALIAAGL
ncbi:PE-PPE domain-containing protein [Mycobacterium sp.]|uniref:PE-PPE domain-containing protein n=1 Tax=Mycobacterium sp. TaxID=1785 RepID=UPI0031DA5D55